jgi:hypothetical protein
MQVVHLQKILIYQNISQWYQACSQWRNNAFINGHNGFAMMILNIVQYL